MSLLNIIGKTNSQLANVSPGDVLSVTYFETNIADHTRELGESFSDLFVTPKDFATSLNGAFSDAKTNKRTLAIPQGIHTLDTALTMDSIVKITGMVGNNPRDSFFDQGSCIQSTLNTASTEFSLTVQTPGTIIDGISLVGADGLGTGSSGILFDRNDSTKTLAACALQNSLVRRFKGDGIQYRAPDNGSLISRTTSYYNSGYGLKAIASGAVDVKGLNLLTIGSRFGWNDAGNLFHEDINQSMYLGCGFLAPSPDSDTAISNIEIIGTNASSKNTTILGCDIENNVAPVTGDTNRRHISLENTRLTTMAFSRIGSGARGIHTDGQVRSLLLIQNDFTGLTEPIYVNSGAAWIHFLGDNNGATPDTITGSGNIHWFETRLSRDDNRAILDSTEILDLQRRDQADVEVFSTSTTYSNALMINGILKLRELTSAPGTPPPSGYRFVYAKNDGVYQMNSSGTETSL